MAGGAPRIAITMYGRDENAAFSLPSEYVDSVRRAGGLPILLAPGEERWRELLYVADGWILAGGGDLDPELHGASAHESVYMVDEERDTSELTLAKTLVSGVQPTLGICRGTQVINVALGGTLHVHLPDVVGDEIAHRAPPREPVPHAVCVEDGTLLASLVEELEFDAESWHHQAIDRVPRELRVVARAPDGTIEAIEMPGHEWLVGVQWHPELTAERDRIQQRIFDRFVEAVRCRRMTRETR